MKKPILLLTFAASIFISCEQTYNCPGVGDNDFTPFFGAFSDYGPELRFISDAADTLSFPLNPSFAEPYSCKTGGNALNKECDCENGKRLRDDLPANSENNFSMSFTSFGKTVGDRRVTVRIDINGLFASMNFNEKEPADNRIELGKGNLHYSNDTTINGRQYNRVLVATDLPDYPRGRLFLSRDEGIVAFTDSLETNWHRSF